MTKFTKSWIFAVAVSALVVSFFALTMDNMTVTKASIGNMDQVTKMSERRILCYGSDFDSLQEYLDYNEGTNSETNFRVTNPHKPFYSSDFASLRDYVDFDRVNDRKANVGVLDFLTRKMVSISKASERHIPFYESDFSSLGEYIEPKTTQYANDRLNSQ